MRSSSHFLTRTLQRFASTLAPLCVVAAAWTQPAQAQLMEPDGTPVPILTGEVGAAPGSLTLNQLFTSRGETLDYLANASTVPATFEPRCSFTGTLVMRGGGCVIEFGWYNANMTSTTPPPDNEIYVLVPTTDPSFADGAFSPQAGPNGPIDDNGDAVELTVFTADSIRTNPNYLGGEIGFALKGAPGQCSQTHFSEQRLNPLCTAAGCAADDHWIAAVIYQSTVTPNAYYIAFEDLPIDPMDFNDNNDGDFNDFVYFVEGITCDGGGVPCDTGLLGVCGPGLTECQPDGSIECRSQIEPSPEVCDAIDNDCDGTVDNGDLCDENFLCVRGNCEPFCVPGEFECQEGFVCIEHVCIEKACAPGTPPVLMECPEGQVCQAGVCQGPCDGVTCPIGQVCEVGVCVDPCEGITCDEDEICQGGVCVLNCNCRPCSTGVCNTESGKCVEPACETVPCTPPQVCQAGACVDTCTGAVCPGGAACANGVCMAPVPPVEGVVEELPMSGGLGGNEDPTPIPAGSAGAGGGSAGEGGFVEIDDPLENFGQPQAEPTKGCGCELPGRAPSQTMWPLLAAFGLLALQRRRRG
jgi:MYXO-CTERM domain-containing protein